MRGKGQVSQESCKGDGGMTGKKDTGSQAPNFVAKRQETVKGQEVEGAGKTTNVYPILCVYYARIQAMHDVACHGPPFQPLEDVPQSTTCVLP